MPDHQQAVNAVRLVSAILAEWPDAFHSVIENTRRVAASRPHGSMNIELSVWSKPFRGKLRDAAFDGIRREFNNHGACKNAHLRIPIEINSPGFASSCTDERGSGESGGSRWDAHHQAALERWLEPFLSRLPNSAWRAACMTYVTGLIGPGKCEGERPAARHLGSDAHARPHCFIEADSWNASPLMAQLTAQANQMVGGADAYLAVGHMALRAEGQHSIGAAPRSASAPGKNAAYQTLVSLTLVRGDASVPVGLRLFLPETWTADPVRLDQAGVPEDCRAFRTRPEIALAEIDRAVTVGVSFDVVLADTGYGLSAPFRQGLSARGLAWAVGILRTQKV